MALVHDCSLIMVVLPDSTNYVVVAVFRVVYIEIVQLCQIARVCKNKSESRRIVAEGDVNSSVDLYSCHELGPAMRQLAWLL